jgi:hypothetical protein
VPYASCCPPSSLLLSITPQRVMTSIWSSRNSMQETGC